MNAYTYLLNLPSSPRVDVAELGDAYRLTAELPGVAQENVSVQVTDGVLELKAKGSPEAEEGSSKWLLRERGQVLFERTFRLPRDVDSSAIAARFTNGLLELTLPKRPEAQPRSVPIQSVA